MISAYMLPATIDPTLNLCTRYPLLLGGQRQCGFKACPTLLHMTGAAGIEPQTSKSRVQRLNRSATRSTIRQLTPLVKLVEFAQLFQIALLVQLASLWNCERQTLHSCPIVVQLALVTVLVPHYSPVCIRHLSTFPKFSYLYTASPT